MILADEFTQHISFLDFIQKQIPAGQPPSLTKFWNCPMSSGFTNLGHVVQNITLKIINVYNLATYKKFERYFKNWFVSLSRESVHLFSRMYNQLIFPGKLLGALYVGNLYFTLSFTW